MTTELEVVDYGVRWNGHLGRLGKVIPAEEARRRHESGELYSAVLGDPEQPYAVVEVRLEVPFVGVQFLDEQQRTYLDYAFGHYGDGPENVLFLRQAIEHRLAPDGEVTWSALHVFDPSGPAEVEEKDYATGEATRYKVELDVSGNWERIPDFGDYASVARLERSA